jgi:hypothetical protein
LQIVASAEIKGGTTHNGLNMKLVHSAEINALLKFNGPRLTRAEIETQIHLKRESEITEQINATPFEVRMRRAREAMAKIDHAKNIEASRAGMWSKIPLFAKKIACRCAEVSQDRAGNELHQFNAFERTRIWTALDDLIDQLSMVQKCMTGGNIPEFSNK